MRVLRGPRSALAAVLLAWLGGCGGGGSDGEVVVLAVLAPSQDVVVGLAAATGPTLTVQVPPEDAGGTLELFADRDGLLTTALDQTVLGTVIVGAAPTYDFLWPPASASPGTYVLFARLRDPEGIERIVQASGRVRWSTPPVLDVRGPTAAVQVSRGGLICVGASADDVDVEDTLDVRLFLDADGDPQTTADAFPLDVTLTPAGCGLVPAHAPAGTYTLLGIADDGSNPPVVRIHPQPIEIENVAWAKAYGRLGSLAVNGMAGFPDGSTLVVGAFSPEPAVFGQGEPEEISLVPDLLGGYLTRYGPDGRVRWARLVGGPTDVQPLADGGCVLVGTFTNRMVLGAGEPQETTLDAMGWFEGSLENFLDRYVARYDADGALVWARRGGDLGPDASGALAVLPNGSIVVTGQDAIPGPPGERRNVLERFAPNGTLATSTVLGRGPFDQELAIPTPTARPDGTTLLSGLFEGGRTFGMGEPEETTLAAAGGTDVFVAALRPDNSLVWAVRAGGPDDDTVADVSVYPDSSFLLSGSFRDTATWGPGEPGAQVRTSAGNTDGYVARYAADGTALWVRTMGSPVLTAASLVSGSDRASHTAVLPDGGFVVTGGFQGPLTIEGTATTHVFAASDFTAQLFLARYDGEGGLLWCRRDGNEGLIHVEPGPVAVTPDGACVSTGLLARAQGVGISEITFGLGEPNATLLRASIDAFFEAYITRTNGDGGY